MQIADVFIAARHCPEYQHQARQMLDSYLKGKDTTEYHTLIAERRYHQEDAVQDNDGIVFILLGDEDELWNERRIVLGWGERNFMAETLRQLSERIPFTPETDRAPMAFSEMPEELQDHLVNCQVPMEWKRMDQGFLDSHLFAIGLNGQAPHAPVSTPDPEA